jgi:hypothetical protein
MGMGSRVVIRIDDLAGRAWRSHCGLGVGFTCR